MVHRNIWFWKELYADAALFCRREGVSFNEVVNRAVQGFLGDCSLKELKLRARLAGLMREEAELRRICSCMLRSGAYLPSYAERVLKEEKGPDREGGPFTYSAGEGDRPLRALNREEEQVFRKIIARREEIVCEVTRIQCELLKAVKPFRLECEKQSHVTGVDTTLDGGE